MPRPLKGASHASPESSPLRRASHVSGSRPSPATFLPAQVPQHLTAEQLRPTFEAYGVIEDITIILDKTTRASKGESAASNIAPTRPLGSPGPAQK